MPDNCPSNEAGLTLPKHRLLKSVLLVVLVIFGSSCSGMNPSLTSVTPITRGVWPQDHSDLAADPDIVFGRLENGLRYIIKENHTPKDRVSMHLYVQAGSLQEREGEQGIAHFLEHMLFNGSKHFPPGEMVKYFQRIGMSFGPDANAHTGFMQTVYDVVLPEGDGKSLSEGLLVLRDYADGALLTAEETDRERNVILAEMRSRDSSRFRTYKALLAFETPGLLVSKRFPIGEADIIRKIDHRMLRNFYAAWYRPDRMIIVVVGDMNAAEAKQRIEERFGTLEPQAVARSEPDFGSLQQSGLKTFFHFEEEAGSTRVAIETLVQKKQPADSAAVYRYDMLQSLANEMVQRRLDAAIRRAKTVLTSADVTSGFFLGRLQYSEISADCRPDQWQLAIAELERAIRRAVLHGFTPLEFECAKGEYRAKLLQSVKESGTRESKHLANEIISSLSDWHVMQSPQQLWDMLNPVLDTVTLEEINLVFAKTWSVDQRMVLVTGNAAIGPGKLSPEAQILAAYNGSRQVAVLPLENRQAVVFPYLPEPGGRGAVAWRHTASDVGVEQVVFENGFSLSLKKTSFKENQVMVALSFGGGRASEPANKPGLAKLTETVVNESGFGQMDPLELQEALAGRLAGMRMRIREDMFVFKGEAASEEVPLLFQLLYAHIYDQGYREPVRSLALKRFEQEILSLERRTEGIMQLQVEAFLAGGDSRFGFPSLPQLQSCTIEDIRQWYGRQLSQAPMEMAVVGDIDPDAVIAMVARYFGTLPVRIPQKEIQRPGPVFPAGRMLRLIVDSQIPKAVVMVAYPTDDFWDIQRTRRLTVMAELFSERLRERIRENLGAAYSPYAYNLSHRAYKGYGLTRIVVQVDPAQADAIEQEVRNIADALSAGGSNEDEFKRVLDPILTHIKDLKQNNSYWLDSVLTGVFRHPQQLDWCRAFEQDYAAITLKEVADYARKYLDNRKAAAVLITPSAN